MMNNEQVRADSGKRTINSPEFMEQVQRLARLGSILSPKGDVAYRALVAVIDANTARLCKESALATSAAPERSGKLADEPTAWVVFAEYEGKMVPQYPACLSQSDAESHAKMYGQTPTEVRALYTRAHADSSSAAPSEQDKIDAARWRYVRDTDTLENYVWEALEGVGLAESGVLNSVAYAAGMDAAVDRAIAQVAHDKGMK